jgi:hypothetical protein
MIYTTYQMLLAESNQGGRDKRARSMYEDKEKYSQGFGRETRMEETTGNVAERSHRTRMGGRGLDSCGSG